MIPRNLKIPVQVNGEIEMRDAVEDVVEANYLGGYSVSIARVKPRVFDNEVLMETLKGEFLIFKTRNPPVGYLMEGYIQ